MVLVEEGPWIGRVDIELRRIQDRLYGCLDAALDGQLAAKFPESIGKRVIIRLDCYNVPVDDVASFFQLFSDRALATPAYAEALRRSEHVKEILFEVNFDH